MNFSESGRSSAPSRRRHDAKRRRVETAVDRLIRRLRLLPEKGRKLSEGIYGLYRSLVGQKSFDDQTRQHRKLQNRAEQELAVRTANAAAFDNGVSVYVADARDFAARIIRLEGLERRNLGRAVAIQQASTVTWAHLSPQERRKAREYLAGNVLHGDKTRQPAREVKFLRAVAGLIAQTTGDPVRFSTKPPPWQAEDGPRHHGIEFEVMVAAAEMVDLQLSNEAMARLIQRVRRQ